MKTLDLFCGCGGLSLGFQNAGYSIVGAFDNWQLAVDTYNANMQHCAECFDLSDTPAFLRHICGKEIELIIGGPPCQDFSSAGKRTENERASLTRVYASLIADINPMFFCHGKCCSLKAQRCLEGGKGISFTCRLRSD